MLKHIVLATMLTCGAMSAYAQTTPTAPAPTAPAPATPSTQAAPPPVASTTDFSVAPAGIDSKKLIGRNIQNPQNETIGEIKSVFLGTDGKADSVVVGVGGFLGMGEREVSIGWKDLKITDGGRKVVVSFSKDELKAMPEYKYKDTAWRGQVFNEGGLYRDTASAPAPADRPMTTDRTPAERRAAADRPSAPVERTAPMAPADRAAITPPPTAPVERTVSTGDFNVHGEMSAEAITGTKVRGQNNETVGSVEDIYLDKNGAVKAIIVSVGGFLGMGAKDVAVKWTDIEFAREGNLVVIKTNWTKDSLKAMPDYKYERREQAANPPATAPAAPANRPAGTTR